jgi:hypothetical protein
MRKYPTPEDRDEAQFAEDWQIDMPELETVENDEPEEDEE